MMKLDELKKRVGSLGVGLVTGRVLRGLFNTIEDSNLLETPFLTKDEIYMPASSIFLKDMFSKIDRTEEHSTLATLGALGAWEGSEYFLKSLDLLDNLNRSLPVCIAPFPLGTVKDFGITIAATAYTSPNLPKEAGEELKQYFLDSKEYLNQGERRKEELYNKKELVRRLGRRGKDFLEVEKHIKELERKDLIYKSIKSLDDLLEQTHVKEHLSKSPITEFRDYLKDKLGYQRK